MQMNLNGDHQWPNSFDLLRELQFSRERFHAAILFALRILLDTVTRAGQSCLTVQFRGNPIFTIK